jgi:Trk-type K+ transport system membrane component
MQKAVVVLWSFAGIGSLATLMVASGTPGGILGGITLYYGGMLLGLRSI